jgi:hypothetical protein
MKKKGFHRPPFEHMLFHQEWCMLGFQSIVKDPFWENCHDGSHCAKTVATRQNDLGLILKFFLAKLFLQGVLDP